MFFSFRISFRESSSWMSYSQICLLHKCWLGSNFLCQDPKTFSGQQSSRSSALIRSFGVQESGLSLSDILNYNDYLYFVTLQYLPIFSVKSHDELCELIQQELKIIAIVVINRMQAQDTPGLELRNKYTREKAFRDNHSDDQYLQKLKNMGIEIHPSLSPAFFQLRNGLEYPGIKTKELIDKRQVTLIKVPQKLILSSIKALQEPALNEVYEQQFYKDEMCWEDRILLTYCLFLVSTKATNNIFYEMVQHMPKDIDVALFWDEEQLDLLKDKTVKCAAAIDLKSFEQQWEAFQEVQKKHAILQTEDFNKQNYRWIFIHIASRCFGKAMDYTSFVPFCELFNHHSSSVRYEINLPEKIEDYKKHSNQQQQSDQSSCGSYASQDYLQQGQFAYDQIERVYYKWGQNQCFDLKKNEKETINNLASKLLQRIQTEIDWKDFSVIFAGHFIMRVKLVQSQYIQGRKKYQQTFNNLETLSQILQKYKKLVKAFYQAKNGKSFEYKVTHTQNMTETKKSTFVRPDASKYKPEYSTFYLKTGKNDIFTPESQVFFCYGPKSNRSLLLNYGFAIEGNKYDHVWLSYPLNDIFKDMPDLMERVQKLGLSIRRKFKVNYTRLNMDLIYFFRLNSWNLYGISSIDDIFFVTNIANELLILEQIRDSLQFSLQMYEDENEEDLQQKSLNYHKYFIKVYNLEKKRILERQIQIYEKLMSVLERLNSGEKMEQACMELTRAEKYMLKYYLSTVVIE